MHRAFRGALAFLRLNRKMSRPSMETPKTLAEHFGNTDAASHGARWDALYAVDHIPWDRGAPSPALIDLLHERGELVRSTGGRKTALVPGCGRGYDVLLLSSWGFDVYGLDVSPLAVEQAKREEATVDGHEVYALKEGVAERGQVTWVLGDFFKNEELEDVVRQGGFSLIYDYTFGCALPPEMRPSWSQRHRDLLAADGKLVCLEFPTYKQPSLRGPPWAMPEKVYLGHLQRPGQALDFNHEEGLIEANLGPPAVDGLERTAHFQPKRAHEIAFVDGKVTDWIGIWVHRTLRE